MKKLVKEKKIYINCVIQSVILFKDLKKDLIIILWKKYKNELKLIKYKKIKNQIDKQKK